MNATEITDMMVKREIETAFRAITGRELEGGVKSGYDVLNDWYAWRIDDHGKTYAITKVPREDFRLSLDEFFKKNIEPMLRPLRVAA